MWNNIGSDRPLRHEKMFCWAVFMIYAHCMIFGRFNGFTDQYPVPYVAISGCLFAFSTNYFNNLNFSVQSQSSLSSTKLIKHSISISVIYAQYQITNSFISI